MRLLIIALFLFPAVASANFISGNKMINFCEDGTSIAFATGVFDTIITAQGYGLLDEVICTSPNMTTAQVDDVMCKYMTDHPEERHLTASSLAWVAFELAFPCSN